MGKYDHPIIKLMLCMLYSYMRHMKNGKSKAMKAYFRVLSLIRHQGKPTFSVTCTCFDQICKRWKWLSRKRGGAIPFSHLNCDTSDFHILCSLWLAENLKSYMFMSSSDYFSVSHWRTAKQNKEKRPWEFEWTHSRRLFFFFLWRYSPNLGLGLPPWNSLFHLGLLDLDIR
jgi:hypothetical protein